MKKGDKGRGIWGAIVILVVVGSIFSGVVSAYYTSTNVLALPPPPTLVSPPDGSTVATTTPTFDWNSVSGADYYGLYVSEPPYGEANLVFDSETDYGPIYGTSFDLPSGYLQNGVTYRWNMRSHNSAGWGNVFSAKWYFTVSQLPPPPTLVSPPDGSTVATTTPTFDWNSVSGADYYGLYVSEPPYGEANLVFDSETDYGPIYGTSFDLPSGYLQNGVTYRWNMRSHNSAGWGNVFSAKWYFTVSQLPPPPTLVSPPDGSTVATTTPTFDWNSVSGADYYGLYVSEPPYGEANLVFDSETDYGPIYGTSFDLPSGYLQNGVTYRWNMRSHNSAGWGNVFSAKWYFTVSQLPPPPTLVSPPDGSTVATTTPTFDWNSVSGADYYGLYVSEPPYGEANLVFDSETDYGPIYGTSFDLPSGYLQNGVTYRWNMRSHNSAGWGNVFSAKWYFTVSQLPPPPTLVSPPDGSTVATTTPTFDWNSVSGADYYGLYVSEPPYGEANLVFDSETDYGPIYGTSFDLPSGYLQNGVTYRWNMRSHNSAGWGNVFSAKWYFQVVLNSPPELSNGYVTPDSGDASTPFDYYVTYKDQDGDAPTTKYVFINGLPNEMLICEASNPSYPEKIRVLRHETGQIDEVDFDYYVKNVLPNEWIASWDMEALKAGAMAVKTYAWYWTIHQKYPGQGYDVRDDTWDQVYNPASSHSRTDQAVEDTWNWVLMKNGDVFQAQYDSGTQGSPDPLYPGRMSQWGTQYWAEGGKDWQWMCHYYYDPMTLTTDSYTSGATFKYSTTLSAGSHNYYFYFDDGHGYTVRLPTSGTFSGPSVSQPSQPITADAGGPYYGNTNEPIQFHGSATGGTPPYTYEWTFDTGETVIDRDPTYRWPTAGTHHAELRVQDSAGLWSKPNVCLVFISDSLLEKYAPVLFFSPFEKFYPTKINALLDHSNLKDKDGNVLVDEPVTVNDLIAHDNEDNYLDMTLIDMTLIKWPYNLAPDPKYFANYPSNIYARKAEDVVYGGTVLQYWIFYPYNHYPPVNAHESDMEMIQILLDSCGNPDRVTYSYHYGANTYKWESPWWTSPQKRVQKIGTHPVVFVECGSHGNEVSFTGPPPTTGKILYPKGADVQKFEEWKYLKTEELKYLTVIDDQTHWVNWKGKWGEQVYDDKGELEKRLSGGVGPKYAEHSGFNVWKYPVSWMHLYDIPIKGWISTGIWGFKMRIQSPVNVHIYDQNNNHVGINENGTFNSEIPGVYYIDSELERAIYITNISNEYRIFIEATDEGEFGLDLERKSENETTLIRYQNISITQNTTANMSLNQTSVNYTMEIDTEGDGKVNITKSPDSIETNYAPSATITSPSNSSIFSIGDKITFNGTGTDFEDGILNNSSLVWSSSINGLIGIGNDFNTSNLSAGIHLIELMVNDSSGQIGMENVTITVIAPDLAIDTSNISFSNPNPREGEAITINATFNNIGTANANSITVQFFDGNPMNGTQIEANQTIASIIVGKNKTVSVVWNTTGEAGDNCIWAVVDPSDSIKEPVEENNQANKSIFVSASNRLHILQAQTDRAVYVENEVVLITCIVQNASINISANVSADIEKTDGIMDNITLMDGLIGNYNGLFMNTSLSGTYKITIYANRTGFIGDNESLSFEILDTTPPASITNITNTTGSTWINWTWDNPSDPDFGYTLIYLNKTWKTATSKGYYLAEGLNASTEYEIETLTVDTEGNINETWVNQTAKTNENELPIASFSYSPEKIVVNQNITFNVSSSYDPDGQIVSFQLDFGDGGGTGGMRPVGMLEHAYSSAGNYTVNLTVTDDDGAENTTSKTITVLELEEFIFDTGSGTYPSIFGTHNGTIKPNQTITVSKLYTYPCAGTGGHTEYARIWNNSGLERIAKWGGYKGDWHNITFNETFVLYKNKTYNYTIRTGSYPQIIHEQNYTTLDGSFINCTEFIDANEKTYTNWIPAIRLWAG